MNALRAIGLSILLLLICLPKVVHAQLDEYALKAVFLERFTRFVEWPQKSEMDDTSKSFILGVVGENPIKEAFEKTFSKKKIKNKKVVIRSISNMDKVWDCHLLFIPKLTKQELLKIISLTKNNPILTVSDSESFAQSGVLINFYILNNKIRFEINERAVRESGLSASYLLLRVAKIVNPIERE